MAPPSIAAGIHLACSLPKAAFQLDILSVVNYSLPFSDSLPLPSSFPTNPMVSKDGIPTFLAHTHHLYSPLAAAVPAPVCSLEHQMLPPSLARTIITLPMLSHST